MIRSLMITMALIGATVLPGGCEPPPRNCDGLIGLLELYGPQAGWDTSRMSRIIWRESRCQPDAYNRRGQASGLLQITPISYPYLRGALGEWIDRWTLMDPILNIRAGAALFDYWSRGGHSGYRPWTL